MYMEKPRIEVVRFDAKDVIATSGGLTYTLTVSNYKNGIDNDLNVNFNNDNYTTYSRWKDLRNALVHLGLGYQTDTRALPSDPDTTTIGNWYDYDGLDSNPVDHSKMNDAVNGTYTWSADDDMWIRQIHQ